MAFPRSQRFVDRESCAPPPTAYSIPSVFDETSAWAGVPELKGHTVIADSLGAPPPTAYSIPSVFDETCAWAKRYSIENQCPQCKNLDHSISCHNSETAHDKDELCSSGRVSAGCTQKKDGSGIPRLRKSSFTPTEGKAPSFMTRPRHTIHNCFIQRHEDNRNVSQQHNYYTSPTKKSKPIKENEIKTPEDALNESSSPKFRIHSRIQDIDHSIRNSDSKDVDTIPEQAVPKKREDINYKAYQRRGRSTGAIPKDQANISDDMKQVESIEELEESFTEDDEAFGCDLHNIDTENENDVAGKISEKDNSLQKEFVFSSEEDKENNSTLQNEMAGKVIDEAVKRARVAIEKVLRIRREIASDSSPEIESHIRFLITDQFIDDEYDTYIKLFSLKDLDWFQICKSVVASSMREYKENFPKEKIVFKTKKNVGSRKVTKIVRNEVRKLAKRRKNNTVNDKTWCDIESIVRAAINNLRDEFKSEVYKTAAIKIDSLMSKLGRVMLNAENIIEKKCELTTGHLVKRLETVMNK